MATVTVRGAGGTTVTLTHLTDAASPAAQAALTDVSNFVQFGLLDQFTWPGSGTVPSPSNLLGGVIVQGGGGDLGGLQPQHVAAMVDATGPTTIVGAANANTTIVAGAGGVTYLNLSKSGEVVLGGGNHGVFNAANGAAASVTLDGTLVAGAMAGISGAGMTVSALAGSLTLIDDHGANAMLVDLAEGATAVTAVDAPSGDLAATIVGGTGTKLSHLALGGGAFINPGAGDATVFGNVGGGTTTVYGGSFEGATAASFTGKLTVVAGHGVFFGGSAGGNLLTTGTAPGAATLVGGGAGDLLISQGAGNMLIAGAGAETLSGFSVDASVGGAAFFAGGGNATIFGNSGGGNTFGLGPGVSQIDGRNEAALTAAGLGVGQANSFFVSTSSGGGHVVADFIAGLDHFNLTLTTLAGGQTLDPATGLAFFAIDDISGANPFAGSGLSGTVLTLSGGTQVFFYDAQVTTADLI